MAAFAVLCPGQGTQTASMFDLAVAEPEGAVVVAAFSAALGVDLMARARADDRLFDNDYAQPAMVAVALATWTVLAPRLPRPSLFAGYSVGEVSAWAAAGAWEAPVAAAVAAARAQAMDRHAPPACGMLAVRGLPRADIERLAPGLFVAIVNESDHVVLAGADAAIEAASAPLAAAGAWLRRLDVHVPSHTPLLAGAAEEFAAALRATSTRDVASPVLRGVDGVACRTREQAEATLPRAIRETIRWDACCRTLSESGVRVALELGPGRSLATLCAANCPEIVVRSVADFRTFAGIEAWVLRNLEE